MSRRFFLRLICWLTVVIFSFSLLPLGRVAAQLSSPGITKCDIDSFIGVHPAYDDCGPLIATAQACLNTTVVGSNNEEVVYNFLVSHGLSPIQAVGVMGNLAVESSFKPTAQESGGDGYGIAQWSFGRRNAIEAAAAAAGVDIKADTEANLVFQLNYLYKEAQGSVWDGLLKQTDVRSATFWWEDKFERPRVSHQEARVNLANGFLTKYGSGSAPTASFSSGCTSSSGTSTNVLAAPNCVANGIVYSDQYTAAQLRAIFGPPVRETHANVVTVNFLGQNVEVNHVIAACLAAVSAELIANNVNYKPEAAKGGFFCLRDNDGQVGDRSYHVYGAACDLNPNTNNYFGDGRPRPYDPNCPIASSAIESGHCFDMSPQVVSAFEHHGFTWGGNWHSIKDYMHFEWHGVTPP